MEEPYTSNVRLDDLQVDEAFWGPGSTPIVKTWLKDNYNPSVMPTLATATIKGREGLWLLGWRNEGTEYHSLLETIFNREYAQVQLDQVEAVARDQKPGVVCPRCAFNRFMPYVPGQARQPNDPAPPALSRADNKTHICSECGTDEAMMDMRGEPLPEPDEWPLILPGSFGQGRRQL